MAARLPGGLPRGMPGAGQGALPPRQRIAGGLAPCNLLSLRVVWSTTPTIFSREAPALHPSGVNGRRRRALGWPQAGTSPLPPCGLRDILYPYIGGQDCFGYPASVSTPPISREVTLRGIKRVSPTSATSPATLPTCTHEKVPMKSLDFFPRGLLTLLPPGSILILVSFPGL